MRIPCLKTINHQKCEYRCQVSGKESPDCFECVVYKSFEANDETIQSLKNEIFKYKNNSDKYEELVNEFKDQLFKTLAKSIIKF